MSAKSIYTPENRSPIMELKYCPDCDQDRPRVDFDVDLRRKDGRKIRCTDCARVQRDWLSRIDDQLKGN